nr:glycine dehydrogenase [FCB group bacterium]
MQYIPVTDDQERKMLAEIGVVSFEDLVKIIPDGLRWSKTMGLEPGLSEMELETETTAIAAKNKAAGNSACFLGGGVYDHYIPKIVDFISGRSEFYTAYTPYQAEVSQGTLQVMYEFQSMICALSAMDVSNASLYDGGSALAEACSMALALTRKKKILISETVNPRFIEVTRTYLQNRDTEIILLPSVKGLTDLKAAEPHLEEAAALVIQSPNYLGILEDWIPAKEILSDNQKCLLVGVSDPISLSIICPPGACGADIFVGEGQVLGN